MPNNKNIFTIEERKSGRIPQVKVTDLDFADDIALTTYLINEAQKLLNDVESAAAPKVGLHLNTKKTEGSTHFKPAKHRYFLSGDKIKVVNDFKYLGSYVDDSEKDIKCRKAQAFVACNKLSKIWNSNLSRNLKIRIFTATVESDLLYGCKAWILTKNARLLCSALNVSWQDHAPNVILYSILPKLSSKIRERRMRLAGHCVRHTEEEASKFFLRSPTRGRSKRGKHKTTYIDTLLSDNGCENKNEIRTAMMDKDSWKRRIHGVRAGARHGRYIDNNTTRNYHYFLILKASTCKVIHN